MSYQGPETVPKEALTLSLSEALKLSLTNSGLDNSFNEDPNADPTEAFMLLLSHAVILSLTQALKIGLT